ncbi:Lactate utilization protein A [Hartmannibacter diazotrophicus]|uniref:Glycolate oxidase iron-sulfur subunit n=1 Tax=Hartmannibacter diazotrophicus TaxID=1482074 RepID=A0A2C9D332_9HYPH|nr:glycolate oxidase subunit GlcF [Hartmannibacter diazotrophicus]SON54599.1 Lactate utilization protein A [Hartmannibacter diazotrophicus]
MQTHFTPAQLEDPRISASERILRTCVHCGFCTATCPTFVLTGDELDSPRGRIYLIKDMLENDRPADEVTALHVDRCLTCLSCMTTCPSGVDYMHLVDHARVHIARTYRRPAGDRYVRKMLAMVLPHPGRFRLALAAARLGSPFAGLLGSMGETGKRLAGMLVLAPKALPKRVGPKPGTVTMAEGVCRSRVALLSGCAQSVLDPGINAATTRLLARVGVEVVLPRGEGCCGALVQHMGEEEDARDFARRNVDAWMKEIDGDGLDAIVITASGCGTTIKDYGHLLADDPEYADRAARVASLAMDISEYLGSLSLPEPSVKSGLRVAYHSACSLQHGQKVRELPQRLLGAAGFEVMNVPESHLCCGSAGTYNILQPKFADRLKARKVRNIESLTPDVIAAGNIGCMTQIGSGTAVPVVHTAELLDWAYGGDKPAALG